MWFRDDLETEEASVRVEMQAHLAQLAKTEKMEALDRREAK